MIGMVKVKLSAGERINLLNMLPAEGDFSLLRISREASIIIGLSDEDVEKFKVVSKIVEGLRDYSWNEEGNKEVELELGPRAFSMICDVLEKKDKEKKLLMNQYSLYEKFVQNKTLNSKVI